MTLFACCMSAISAFGLDHSAARGDRCRVRDLAARERLPHAVGDEEAHALLDADAVKLHAAVLHDAGDHVVRALVFLPDAHFVAKRRLDQLARAILFEAGTHVRDRALRGNDDAERALALAPAHADVVEAARRPFHEDGVHLLVGHEFLGFRDPRFPLIVRNRHDAGGHRRERRDRGMQPACLCGPRRTAGLCGRGGRRLTAARAPNRDRTCSNRRRVQKRSPSDPHGVLRWTFTLPVGDRAGQT